jgi:Fuc2NAc and GlcNAc transferase
MNPLVSIALMFCVIAAVSWFAVGKLIKILLAKNIVDHPNHRTLHEGAIPRGGGLVIVASLIIALVSTALFSSRPQLFTCVALLVLAWASLSWYDDKHDLSARFRLLIQSVICVVTIAALGWVSILGTIELHWFGPVLSVVGVLWMANLYNFMDGMDGLAASQTIVASISLSFWFYVQGDTPISLVCVVLAASSYGFLIWNWSPAKVFMGDVGSISLGGFFAVLFLLGVTRHDLSIFSFFGLFGVFIADSTITILLRCWRGEKIWLPHRQHFYQRLANAGYCHSKITLGAVVLMVICSLFATLGVVDRDMISVSLTAILVSLASTAALVIYLERRVAN